MIEMENGNYKRHIELSNIILEKNAKSLSFRLTRNRK